MQQVISQDAAAPDSITDSSTTTALRISGEILIYGVLIVIALFLRVAELDSVPMAQTETHNALAAYRATVPEASGEMLISDTPAQFWAQRIAITLIGGNEFAVRIFTVLASIGVCLLPLFFRDVLGKSRALVMSILLTLSPVMFIASRQSSGTIWALLFAGIGMWALWRFYQQRTAGEAGFSYGVGAIIAFVALILLAEPGGILLGIMLLIAGIVASIMTALDASVEEEDRTPSDILGEIRGHFIALPLGVGMFASAFVVFIVATGFMFDPSSLNSVGAVLESLLNGFTTPQPNAPLFFPLFITLFYEPWIVLFGAAAIIWLVRRGHPDFVERFFMIWIAAAIAIILIYQGAGAAHALWLVIPLIGLASYLIDDALKFEFLPGMWLDDFFADADSFERSLRWGRWVIALAAFALTFMLLVHLQIVGRGFLNVPGGTFTALMERVGSNVAPFNLVTNSLIWLLLTALFFIVGFFLAASIWGNQTAARGGMLGIALFALLSGTATGWGTAVTHADDPIELWHIETQTDNATKLRETMQELALRETMGVASLPIFVADEDDGFIGWLLRDFTNVTYVNDASAADRGEIVLLYGFVTDIDLGGSYVGQTFNLTSRFYADSVLTGFDFLPWQLSRDVRGGASIEQIVTLWVRQDIFNSQPFVPGLDSVG